MMNWKNAKKKIESNIIAGTNINTEKSTYRIVESTNSLINSKRYNYYTEFGFVVPIGKTNKIKIPWNVLKECFLQAGSTEGYGSKFFKKRYPLQYKDHPCHVHVIGQIMVIGGVAKFVDGRYRVKM